MAGDCNRASVLMVDASTKMQTAQAVVFADDVRDKIEHFEPYGFTSCPQDCPENGKGAEGIVLDLDGNSDHSVLLVVADRRYRLTGLEKGEVALHDDQGQRVHFKRDGIAVETGRSGGVTITVTNHAPCTVIADAVHLGGANLVPSLNGVVTGEAFDTFTGALQSALGNASTKVMAKKA